MLKTGSFNSVAGTPGWVASTFERAKMVTFGENGEALFEEIDGGFLVLMSSAASAGPQDEFSDPSASSALFIPGLSGLDIEALSRGERLLKRAKNEFELDLQLVLQQRRPDARHLFAVSVRANQDAGVALFLYKHLL